MQKLEFLTSAETQSSPLKSFSASSGHWREMRMAKSSPKEKMSHSSSSMTHLSSTTPIQMSRRSLTLFWLVLSSRPLS
jgi:hypothetical protein